MNLQGRMGLLSHDSLQSNFLSDAIIESLPRGLSGKEREKVFQSVPLSPTLNLLSSMPQVAAPSHFSTISRTTSSCQGLEGHEGPLTTEALQDGKSYRCAHDNEDGWEGRSWELVEGKFGGRRCIP